MLCLHAHVYRDPQYHDPILLVPDGSILRIFNITHFQAPETPPFPWEDEVTKQGGVPDLAKRMEQARFTEDTQRTRGEDACEGEGEGEEDGDDEGEGEGKEYRSQEFSLWPKIPLPLPLFEAVPGWKLDVAKVAMSTRPPDIDACEVFGDGALIAGVGKKGTMYIWRLNEQPNLSPSATRDPTQ